MQRDSYSSGGCPELSGCLWSPTTVASGVAAPAAIVGPPGEPAGAVVALPMVGRAVAVTRWLSRLVQAVWKSTCTLPFTWITIVPGVGFASAPGRAGAW